MSGGGQKEPCALVATPFEVRHPASQSFDASGRKLVGLGRHRRTPRAPTQSRAPASYFASAAARARSALRAGSRLRATARSRKAAVAAGPRGTVPYRQNAPAPQLRLRQAPAPPGPDAGAPVGVDLAVGGLGERAMGPAPLAGRRRLVKRRANQWVAKADQRPDLDQPVVLGRRSCIVLDLQDRGRPPQDGGIPDWAPLLPVAAVTAFGGQSFCPTAKALFDLPRYGCSWQGEAPCEIPRGPMSGPARARPAGCPALRPPPGSPPSRRGGPGAWMSTVPLRSGPDEAFEHQFGEPGQFVGPRDVPGGENDGY